MKIVNLEEFRALPPGTLFAKYEPCVFEALMIKGETWEHDWLYQDIVGAIDCSGSDDFADKLFDAEENKTSLPMDFDCGGRDGCFDKQQLFAVYEKDDMEKLMDKLARCVAEAYT